MTDKAPTCGQNSCEADAVYRMFWPNNAPTMICQPCRERAEGIAGAMGFYLHFEPIAPDDAGPQPASEEA